MKEENERRRRLPTPMTRLTKILWTIVLIDLVLLVAVTVTALVARAEYVNAYNGLCVRAEPNTDAEVLEVLPFAEEVHGNIVNGWMQIEDGFLNAEYLSETNPLSEAECLGVWRVTAYAATGNMTASGTWPEKGWSLATNYLPFGSVLYLTGYGIWEVQDRGPTSLGSLWCDLFLENEADCIAFGETTAEVYLLYMP